MKTLTARYDAKGTKKVPMVRNHRSQGSDGLVYIASKKVSTQSCMERRKARLSWIKRRFKVELGTYVEFNDGCTIQGPDGRLHRGKGTIVRFNYRHGTWSVQRPQSCETNVLGYAFTMHNEPCWLNAKRESGMTTLEFQRKFSPAFVKLCIDGQPWSDGNAEVCNSHVA